MLFEGAIDAVAFRSELRKLELRERRSDCTRLKAGRSDELVGSRPLVARAL